jgi:murein DD-endopeptidase MepM/ murein hydrolase activator NlpD
MNYTSKYTSLIYFFSIIILLSFSVPTISFAETSTTTTEDLISKIEAKNNIIKQLEEEIKQYNLEVENANKQGVTLKNTIKTLDLTKKKIGVDINLTENKISKTSLTINQLGVEINKTKNSIDVNKEAIKNAIKETFVLEDMSILQVILSNKDIGDIWNEIDNIKQTQNLIRDKSKELAILKTEMETKQSNLSGQKKSLLNLKQDLNGKKQAVIYTTKEKEVLLAQTKNKEEAFKELVKTREEQKAQFEREVYEYESELNLIIDENKYPVGKTGILSWPLDYVYITQKFGKTVAAKKLYVSGSHNGVDFRASTGTRVKNVLDGVIVGTGNTDAYPGCYSFGKWVMIKHSNGLSTIYGHLSVISVSVGQTLQTGDLIGYSGNTGYSTGPHLHIGVYATQGVRIEKYVNSRGCKQVTMPLADIKAYLDPLAYFPN